MADRKAKALVPLTDAQAALAAQWLPLGQKLATEYRVDLGVTLEALCEAARRYDPARGNGMQAWATSVMRNAAIDELRRQRVLARATRNTPMVRLVSFSERLHGADLGYSDPDGERHAAPQPCKKWVAPPDPVVRSPRPAGTSLRSIQRRAKRDGCASPPGRPSVLSDKILAAVLSTRPGITSTQLADALGVSTRTLRRADEKRHDLRRMRRTGLEALLGKAPTPRPTPDRAPTTGHAPSAPAPPRWM